LGQSDLTEFRNVSIASFISETIGFTSDLKLSSTN
jgi:hypothetical protein